MPEKRQPDSYHGARLGALKPPGVLLSFFFFFFFFLLGFAAPAAAQSSIAGQVTDESGGVLPGVMVEVASPVLIEKVGNLQETIAVTGDSVSQEHQIQWEPTAALRCYGGRRVPIRF
jgi:hypothetical protein